MQWYLFIIVLLYEIECSNLLAEISAAEISEKKYCSCDMDDLQEIECRCSGSGLLDIPREGDLPTGLISLIIEDAGIEVLKQRSLAPYSATLKELYIHRAPKLLKIQTEVFNVVLPNLKILRIVNTGLEEMVQLSNLTTPVLHMIDLENNNIKRINPRQVSHVKAEQLSLNYNDLRSVEEEAFLDSEIAKISFKGNAKLTFVHQRAFFGLKSLRQIDLSDTAIMFLPTEGLHEIEVLKVQVVESLKVFPSVFNFRFIKEAWLTYPYHCCAFKFPHTHNPWEYERHKQFERKLAKECTSFSYNISANSAEDHWNQEEFFHNSTISLNGIAPVLANCGHVKINYLEVECHPAPDAFNPCEDIMGNWILRIPVWFISSIAIIGNLFVIIVICTSHFRLTVSKFLMCNLAIADLCIGIHLLLIAIVDACSIGVYFNYAIDWQIGDGCRIAGFLTVFGNVLSVYTLTIITTERWYTITWAIQLNRRLKLRTTIRAMIAGWLTAIVMALLPLVGVSSYSKTSICLPLETKGKIDVVYLSLLLILNAFAFILICGCYGSMYKSIKTGTTTRSITCVRPDLTIAKRMALLVFTDFACWSPIAFFGLTALLGHPLITVTQTKILLVFFYPLNSCANPLLYALVTQQYRRDFFILMGRYGLCKDRAERHKGAIGGKPLPYKSAPRFKKPNGKKSCKSNSSISANGQRSSVLTTCVSVELTLVRSGSKHSHRCRPEYKNVGGEIVARDTYEVDSHGKLRTTENL
ncbi:lutropin-choriogonadotropic hormone receptor-like [Agrilus planipennis]|uniref:Lutropin-choriogonadotropic hormone receptor-like n=1 Tax=Agrilus planipennis TaxID=224129 RepID=A0A1W4W6I0_AGRPL|nr:lutropin-choriogonadotropic hormone receptor-like [Agrilus planipennis]